jgi:hypothetical protein
VFNNGSKGPNNREELMARRAQVVEVMLAVLMLVGILPNQNRAMAQTTQVLTAGPAVTWRASVKLADKVNDLLFGAAPEARRLRVFVRSVDVLTGGVDQKRVCPSGRTDRVCRQMGELLLHRQALEREGRKPQVAAFLNKVRGARSSGIPEAQVRAMVREGLARGELRPNADRECRAIQRRFEALSRELTRAPGLAIGEPAELTRVSTATER